MLKMPDGHRPEQLVRRWMYLTLDAPGEYLARITATYWDRIGDMWVGAMTHVGVVYPSDTPIIANGKKLLAGGRLEREESSILEKF